MRNKGLLAIVAVMAVVAMGGIGFAAFSSSVPAQVNASSGTLTLVWTGFYNHGFAPANATYMTCSDGPGVKDSSVMYFSATNMAGGDSCFYNSTIQNTVSLPDLSVEVCYSLISYTGTGTSPYWTDTLGGNPIPLVTNHGCTAAIPGFSIPAGGSTLYSGQMQWLDGQGATESFAVTVVGYVGA